MKKIFFLALIILIIALANNKKSISLEESIEIFEEKITVPNNEDYINLEVEEYEFESIGYKIELFLYDLTTMIKEVFNNFFHVRTINCSSFFCVL